ncbi:hypothetical protein [Aquitalea magnusonii]|nr:hypothetical protein [Aquitalea magnusonii]
MQNRINEIEVAVATGTMSASQCFTQMRQLLPPNNPYLSEYPIKLVCNALITIVTHSGDPEGMAEALKPWRTRAEALIMPGKQQATPDDEQSAVTTKECCSNCNTFFGWDMARAKPMDRITWGMDKQSIRLLAAELIRGADCIGDDETEFVLEVRASGTVKDDDDSLNAGPILAILDGEYPEEGVYPIDPHNPTAGREPEAAPQQKGDATGDAFAAAITDELLDKIMDHVRHRNMFKSCKSELRALLAAATQQRGKA